MEDREAGCAAPGAALVEEEIVRAPFDFGGLVALLRPRAIMRAMRGLRATSLLTFVTFAILSAGALDRASAQGTMVAIKQAPSRPPIAEDLVASSNTYEPQRVRLANAASVATMAKLRPAVQRVLERAAVKPKPKEAPIDLVVDARSAVTASFGARPEADIEALVMLVLMEASKSAREDLKEIMAKVKAVNAAKQALRCQSEKDRTACLERVRSTSGVAKEKIDEMLDAAQGKADALAGLGEEHQLRMQLAMDRLAKANSAASSLMRKYSETTSAIIQNIK